MKQNIIKTALAAAFLAVLALAIGILLEPGNAGAQTTVRTGPPLLFSTASLPAKVLTNSVSVTNTMECAGGKDVAFQLNVVSAGLCTSNVLCDVYYSVDGSIYELWKSFGVAATSTTRAHVITNYTINAVQKVKVVVSTTAITSAGLTNTTLYGAVK